MNDTQDKGKSGRDVEKQRKLDKRAEALRANLKRRKDHTIQKLSPSGKGLDEGSL